MSRTARDNIHEQDKRWMTWLKATSRRKGSSGQTLLQEYATDKDAWKTSIQVLREQKQHDWLFCRGPLSDVEMAAARERYLSQYVFVAGENCSQSYVDSLLAAEDAQICMRLNPNAPVQCALCEESQCTIRRLSAALSAREIKSEDDIRLAAIVSIFQRFFLLGEGFETPRKYVRRTIESVMRKEISPAENIGAKSNLWHRFISETLGEMLHTNDMLPCRCREPPISQADFAAETAID